MSTSHSDLPMFGTPDLALKRVREAEAYAAAGEPDDETLLIRVQSADMDALGLLFQRYSRIVLSIARRVLQDANEAEDLVQDVFLFLFYKGKTFDPAKGVARSWLMQITYHRAYDRRRYLNARSFYDRSTSSGRPEIARPPCSGDNPEEFMIWQSCIRPAFDELSEDQQKTLILHFFDGYTIREISEKLGQPFGRVQHHLYRGIDRLRKHVFKTGNKDQVVPTPPEDLAKGAQKP